jgi:hypothetical protein
MSCLLSKIDDFIITKKIPVSRKFFQTKPWLPQFFFIAEDLDESFTRLHKSKCRMDDRTTPIPDPLRPPVLYRPVSAIFISIFKNFLPEATQRL